MTGKVYISGLGLGSIEYLPLVVLNLIKKVDIVFLETYTGFIDKNMIDFIKSNSNKLVILTREDCEVNNYEKIINEVKSDKDVLFLTQGDPLIATTHQNLILTLHNLKIEFKIIPSISIISSAISLSGLQIYKFSCFLTFPIEYRGVKSVYEKINEAYNNNKHSLILFEYDLSRNTYVTPKELAEYLFSFNFDNTDIIIFQRLGLKDQKIFATDLESCKDIKFENPPYTAIIPGKTLHSIEKEYIRFLKNQ